MVAREISVSNGRRTAEAEASRLFARKFPIDPKTLNTKTLNPKNPKPT